MNLSLYSLIYLIRIQPTTVVGNVGLRKFEFSYYTQQIVDFFILAYIDIF